MTANASRRNSLLLGRFLSKLQQSYYASASLIPFARTALGATSCSALSPLTDGGCSQHFE